MEQELIEKLEKFLEGKEVKSEEEMDKLIAEFVATNDISGLDDIENMPMAQAYEWLERAENAKTEKTQIKYAKKALEICPECIDASLFLAVLKKNPFEMIRNVEEAVEQERKRLEKEKYFTKDYIGVFYGVFETRGYMRGMDMLLRMYADKGMTTKAIEVAKEILKLNENDNMGARFILMSLYALREEEKELKALYKKYSYDCVESLVPFLVLYYKLGEYAKAQEYLAKINKCNKHFKGYFKDEIPESECMDGYYKIGDISEVLNCVSNMEFLFRSVEDLEYFILKDGVV